MSKSGQIWEQYIALDEITDEVNRAIIHLKKAFLLSTEKENHPRLAVSDAEVLVARNILNELFRFISSLRQKGKESSYTRMPEPAATELRTKLDALLPPKRKMADFERAIYSGISLTHYHFRLLDDLIRALDAERSLIIQNLRKTNA
ncbi:MAG: hypothetical protein Q8937_04260 [Bacteroidota bacterium]|nr:hypothetical protein [Bacteroidota bacterium]MDP4257423.1 hypothetical protein [Bacteroidota bacterium]